MNNTVTDFYNEIDELIDEKVNEMDLPVHERHSMRKRLRGIFIGDSSVDFLDEKHIYDYAKIMIH